MITLLGTLIGFLSAAFPDLFKMLRDKSDRAHELKILEMQLEQQRQGHTERMEEIHAGRDAEEITALYKTYESGIEWVDALNGTVRPVLAYAFFLLYAFTKALQYTLIDISAENALYALWSEEDQAIFAGIISFYFGSRAMGKLRPKA